MPGEKLVPHYDLRESEIRDMIMAYLDQRRIFAWRDYQPNVIGKSNRGPRTYGVADILGIYRGRPLAIEVKTTKGDLSIRQFNWLEKFREAGGIVIVATSVEEVHRHLTEVSIAASHA